MTILNNYQQFSGSNWETASVINHLAYRGVKAPHTNQPFTEAMLMGISGGAVMGYFSFAYAGHDPNVAILTRNTFSPIDTILERLGIVQTRLHTASADKAVKILVDTLENGVPAIVWADMYSLPYNNLSYDEQMWVMMPIIVYGYDAAQDMVWIADRSEVPLTVTTAELAAARGRVKKDKHRILTLEMSNPDKLASAVQKGIWDCIKLYTEAPPKGARNNFGFAAYQRWADLLIKSKQRLSWAKEFPPGSKLYSALTSVLERIAVFGNNGTPDAERGMYADFLEEANMVLNKPTLLDAAEKFRESAEAWGALAKAALPDHIPPFRETRELLLKKAEYFATQGAEAQDEILKASARLAEIKEEVAADFPLDERGVADLQENLRGRVLDIADIEQEAVNILQEALT
jgi:hypothetical protein